jgi:iron(III) transport system ATP-binding protein
MRRMDEAGTAARATPATPAPDEPAAPAEAAVRVRNLTKRFRRGDGTIVTALDEVSFDVPTGEMVVLVGPSGCGKTTLLRSIAGLEHPDRGLIAIHDQTCFDGSRRLDIAPEHRPVSMVFQSYALWPHMTALQNVAYPLRANRKSRERRASAAERARQTLTLVGIGDLTGQYPHQMSGGQRQRVALARALVAGTDVVLFDEPLSNVDARVRTELRLELVAMQRDLGFSAVFVTHDQAEAMELAHHLVVMDHGHIAQMGTPQTVYDEPATRYVATFIGSANELTGQVTGLDPLIVPPAGVQATQAVPPAGVQATQAVPPAGAQSTQTVRVETVLGEVTGRSGSPDLRPGDTVVALWRPERTRLDTTEPRGPNRWPVHIDLSRYLGTHTRHVVDAQGPRFEVWQPGTAPVEGDRAWICVDPADVIVLPKDQDPLPSPRGSAATEPSRSEGRRRLPGLASLDASAASENEEGRQPVSRPGDEAG